MSAATGGSSSEQEDTDIEAWVPGLNAEQRDRPLIGLLRSDDPFLRVETLRTARPKPVRSGRTRTAAQSVTAAEEFTRRIEALQDEQRRKPAFVERLVAAGLSSR